MVPQGMGSKKEVRHPHVLAIQKGQMLVLLGVIERDVLLKIGTS